MESAQANQSEQGTKEKPQLVKSVDKVFSYGPAVIGFHYTVAVATIGLFYIGIDRGVDVPELLSMLPFSRRFAESRFANSASTAVAAFACQKMTAPARLAFTIACAPLIVSIAKRWEKKKLNKP